MTSPLRAQGIGAWGYSDAHFSVDCCLNQVLKYLRCTAAWNGEPERGGQRPGLLTELRSQERRTANDC